MKVLLTHGYFLEEDKHEKRIMKPYPPLGILYLSAYLKSRGVDVQVFDSTFQRMSDFRSYINLHKPDTVGIYTNLMTKLRVIEMIRFLKQSGSTVILGGPEPAYYAEEFLRIGADVIVIGEGEQTLSHVIEAISHKGVHRLHKVPGTTFMDESGNVQRNEPRELIKDLDTLPFPDRDAIPIQDYVATWKHHHGMGSLSLITARGCPYTCTWCSHGVYGFTHRRRTPKNVVDEIEMIRERYRPDMLWIADDVFTINHKWLYQYADEMRRRNLALPFECISRADRLNDDILKTLSGLGCFRIWYGSESGSQRVLDEMTRGVTTVEIQQMTKSAQRHGIQVGLFVMLGYEAETMSDIEATIDHLKRTEADVFLTTVAYPIKGTAYHELVKSRVSSDLPWERRTERDLQVHGRFHHRFYWFAQRRMTNEVLFHKLSRNGSGNVVQRTGAFVKAKVAHLGMKVTSRWKS